jgi:BirA family biotin operon repressor/biotin-[acetyl-CoA-carboxylase] ligase
MSLKHKPLDTERIRDAIKRFPDSYTKGKLSFFESIESTNAWLHENGDCGDICLSEMQTAGRGRRDNIWVSPPSGNIYFSYCACFDDSVEYRSLLGLVAGIAIAEALDDIGLSGHGIKWPNDIYWQQQKLGGILIETSTQSDKFIIGLGLNLSLPRSCYDDISQAAVSLDDAINGKSYSRDELVIILIQRLSLWLKTFKQMSFDDFLQNWKEWDILHEKTVSFNHQGSVVTGNVSGLDKHGRLAVTMANGECEYFSSADIRLSKRSL